MDVPVARGLLTIVTGWKACEVAVVRLPTDQVTTPEAKTPPAVAETKVALAGTVSEIGRASGRERVEISVVAVSVKKKEAATGAGEAGFETERSGAELRVVETAAPATGAVSLESML